MVTDAAVSLCWRSPPEKRSSSQTLARRDEPETATRGADLHKVYVGALPPEDMNRPLQSCGPAKQRYIRGTESCQPGRYLQWLCLF